MSYAIEYHKDEGTIEGSKAQRRELIETHMAKYLGGFPEEVQAQMLEIAEENLEAIYGQTKYVVKDVHRDDLQNLPGAYLVESAPDESWTRITFDSEEDAKKAGLS